MAQLYQNRMEICLKAIKTQVSASSQKSGFYFQGQGPGRGSCCLSRKCCSGNSRCCIFFNLSMCFSKISSFPPHTLILESDQSQATVLCFCWENTIFIQDAEARLCKPPIASEKQICFRLDRNHVTKFISCSNLFA